MSDELKDFVEALGLYVRSQLAAGGNEGDYCRDAVEILDARNLLFRHAGQQTTDEVENVYALRDLCRVDEETMELVPDEGRLLGAARNCGLRSE